jgi:hypothetical protein
MNPKKSHHLSHLYTYLKPWGLRPKNKREKFSPCELVGILWGCEQASEKVFGFFYPSDPPPIQLNGGYNNTILQSLLVSLLSSTPSTGVVAATTTHYFQSLLVSLIFNFKILFFLMFGRPRGWPQ